MGRISDWFRQLGTEEQATSNNPVELQQPEALAGQGLQEELANLAREQARAAGREAARFRLDVRDSLEAELGALSPSAPRGENDADAESGRVRDLAKGQGGQER